MESRFQAIVLYDGTCVLCNWFVRFILRIDGPGRIGFAPLASPIGLSVHDRIPEGTDSVALLEGNSITVRSEAVFRVFMIVGGAWKIMAILRILPTTFTDAVYDWIARRRSKIFGQYEACPMPEHRHRNRFMGVEELTEKD